MRRQDIRNNKGITLIALIVTIVVILILAGVSISMLTGEDGIIKQAQDSKEDTRGASAKEEIDLWKSNIKMDKLTGSETAEKQEDLLNRLVEDGTLTQEEADKLEAGETITIGKSEISLDVTTDGGSGGGNEITLPMPENAVVSQITGEYESEDEGIVIYIMKDADGDGTIDTPDWTDVEKMQTTYDQFVWVPVPNPVAASDAELTTMMSEGKYPIAVAIEGTDDNGLQNYRGALYDFVLSSDGTKVDITARDWSESSTSFREPAYLTSSSSGDASGHNNVGVTEELLQEEYNKMVDRVKTNKGFWVGRYETSNMSSENTNDSTQQIKVIKGTTTGIRSINWYRMYAQQKNYSKLALGSATTTTSSMIWGSQWDQIMIWMKEVQNTSQNSFYVVNAIGMGNYGTISGVDDGYSDTSNPAATGCFEVKNVYDLAGNVEEWTLEADDTNTRVHQGGRYQTTVSSNTRADYRGYYNPIHSVSSPGSRSTLY